MENLNYRVLSCEGRDQVGKGDALNYLLNELEKEDVSVVTTSFPIYGTPIGNTIRVLLKEGEGKFGLTPREGLEVKMSLFALNRLEFLEAFLSEDVSEDSLVLFDRSAFSNALTIAYAMNGIPNMTEEEIKEMVDIALELDSLLIETLDLKKCVVQLVTEQKGWINTRGEEIDLHEVAEVQEYADYVYNVYREAVGEGWREVVTIKEDGEFRKREEIFQDVYGFLKERLGEFNLEDEGFNRSHFGIQEIMENIYVGSEVEEDLLREYVGSIKSNDKDLMYPTSIKVKEGICSSYEDIRFKNQCVKDAFTVILGRYPKIIEVLEYNLGGKFVNDLIEGLRSE